MPGPVLAMLEAPSIAKEKPAFTATETWRYCEPISARERLGSARARGALGVTQVDW